MEVTMQLPHLLVSLLRLVLSPAGLLALGTGFFGAWFASRRAGRQASLQQQTARLDPEQLTMVMQALDSICVEVERISEAQRFTSRILAERPGTALPLLKADSRSITPH
jgi:hypothetical protein